jgi:dephospho-CoA kinase
MTFKLGLTGSIGMGKSTTAQMFVDLGCALWDADAAVHELYAPGGAAVAPMSAAFPDAIEGQSVSRAALRQIIAQNPAALRQIEAIVHPLVAKHRSEFVAGVNPDITVFDIPLMFETGGDADMDATVCVFVPDDIQEERVMERGTMTRDQFLAIRAKQISAVEKCARADYVIQTDTLAHARAQVHDVVGQIRAGLGDA